MVKLLLKLFLILALFGYLIFAFIRFTHNQGGPECEKVTIEIFDTDKANFVTEENIRQILIKNKLTPTGRKLTDINIADIKRAVDKHQFVLSSVCYTKPNGEVCIEVTQKLPILRIMPTVGEGYYIDINGEKIPHIQYPADVVIVTGNVDYNKSKTILQDIGQIINNDEFWDDMIEQINVTESGSWEFVPRLGSGIVVLGTPQDIEQKMSHLKTFFEKVIPQVGWNKYKRISVEYDNQVVCEKNE